MPGRTNDDVLGTWPPTCVHGRWLSAFCYVCLVENCPSDEDVVLILGGCLRTGDHPLPYLLYPLSYGATLMDAPETERGE